MILMEKFPQQKEDASDVLSTSVPLWYGMKKEFPHYDKFIRPSLDDNEVGSFASDYEIDGK